MSYFQIYLTIGLLLMVATFGAEGRWPKPIEAVLCALVWPVPLFLAIRALISGSDKV